MDGELFRYLIIEGDYMKEFNIIWDEFNGKLLNYIRSMVSNEHDAEDILQNVFIKIYNNVDQLDEPSAIQAWIFRIAKNTVIDFYKKKKDVSFEPEKFLNISEELEEDDNLNKEITECMKNMIFTLPEKYKQVYDMYENQEMKHKEIAQELDISVSNSKVRLKRAKSIFKDMLVDCCDFEVDSYGNIIEYHQKKDCGGCSGSCN